MHFSCTILAGFWLFISVVNTDDSKWPAGLYGLPKPLSGCPSGVAWATGWRFQDTKDKNPSNSRSTNFHMEGLVRESSVNRSFCIKNQRDDDATTTRPIWPDGKYCIYQSDLSCPTGLRAGSVTWGDEETNNLNSKGGVLPKGIYNDGVIPPITALQFCCSVMGDPSVPLSLPVDSPFYLMPYGSKECQQVEWAVGELEWIYFDSNGIHNEVRAPYPYGANVVGHTIHYCYYTSCKYNLIDSTGTFQSPRFPQKYPDGQLCSWRIIVNPGHVINVHFTNFSLTGGSSNDVLKLFDGGSDRAKLMKSLYGNVIPGDVRSTSNELFAVFSSDNAWSGGGFRAEYKAVDPVEGTMDQIILGTEWRIQNA